MNLSKTPQAPRRQTRLHQTLATLGLAAFCAGPAAAATSSGMGAYAFLGAPAGLNCQRVNLTLVPEPPAWCPPGTICGPGSTPGMSQLLGSVAGSTTGSATVGGYDPGLRSQIVNFNYAVADLTVYAPKMLGVISVTPTTSRLWVIKADTLPGAEASDLVKQHVAGDLGARLNGTTTMTGAKRNSAWQLIGQVSATVRFKSGSTGIQYAFACVLPLVNTTVQLGP